MYQYASACLTSLEFQAGFARAFGNFRHTAGVKVTAAVENDLFHALVQRAAGHDFTHQVGSFLLVLAFKLRLNLCIQRRRSGKGMSDFVVDDLRVNVVKAAVYIEPRPLGGTQNVPAGTVVTFLRTEFYLL